MNAEHLKQQAAEAALDYVKDGMKLGLGTGSTAVYFIKGLGEMVANGLNVICVPTSIASHELAKSLNIPLTTLDETPKLDLVVDGADELDAELNLIKGGGAALLREKIVAAASAKMVVIADDSKLVAPLGAYPLPVEVIPFGAAATVELMHKAIKDAGSTGAVTLRNNADGTPLITDGGHYIYDCALGSIANPKQLALNLNVIPGVVEHGLFIGLAQVAILATKTGIQKIEI
ncbi:MAG: ribose-5-phosphate isomerase RpiA [Rhizobiales bacterium]|nr:ribose-5-phosphate isomerase RpiA [Hyphomicrobiales bacterium]NRB13040.1 ribose-5-phosphate isomerase RpiA [Hyphomicrobiales bacterium]